MPETVTPYLYYEDVAKAIGWLSETFGFQERLRFTDACGDVTHAEMAAGDGAIMLGQPGIDYVSPRSGAGVTVGIHVYVDDVDAHCARASTAGATILKEPSDQPYGDRRYDVEDREGHHWFFATRIREVAPEEWGATLPEGAATS